MSNYLNQISQALEQQKFSFVLETPSFSLFQQSKVCGDKVELFVILDEPTQTIKELSYQNSSCGLNTMLLEWFCGEFQGKHLEEAKALTFEFLQEKFQFPKGKAHCAELLIQAIEQISDSKYL